MDCAEYFPSPCRVPRHVESKVTQWVRFQYTEQLSDSQASSRDTKPKRNRASVLNPAASIPNHWGFP